MILKSPLFRKLLWIALLPVATALLLANFLVSRYQAQNQESAVARQLGAEAEILLGELPAVSRDQMAGWAARTEARTRLRVTLIEPGGSVLADSQNDSESHENLASRPEMQQAMAGRSGTAIRHSATLNRELFYLATPFAYQGRPGYVLRLAVPLNETDDASAVLRRRILEASLFAAALAFGIAWLFSRSLIRRIGLLRKFAEGLVAERPLETRLPEGNDELSFLGRSLHHTSDQVRGLVERLSQESDRRQAILSSMVEGVLAVDNEFHVTFCNQAFQRLFGIAKPITEPAPLVELVRDAELTGMLREVLESNASVTRRLQLPAAEGRSFEAHAGPLGGAFRRGAIAILHDVTSLERLERIRKDFVANVSHELRTPLTAICGYAETLLEGALEDKENNRKFIEIIKTHANRLNSIASDLLTLSELEADKPLPDPERVSVRAALESALRTIETEAKSRRIILICDHIEDTEIMGYKLHFEQAVLNLLQNAVKFNRSGGVVRLETSRAMDGNLCITVADTGVGIPSQDLSRIFERFYRVDRARSREVGGTGLGLSIVKHVIERMHGTVSVESQLGKGSVFKILLPCC